MPKVPVKWVRVALRATAVLNIAAALGALVLPSLHAEWFLGPNVILDGLMLRYHMMMWSFVLAMGFGYVIASRDPARQTGLMVAAAVGKLFAAGAWSEMLFSGLGAWPLAAGIVWDGALGVLFSVFVAQRLLNPQRLD